MGHPAKDYYAILGVKPQSAQNRIKQAYRRLARRYHPDLHPNDEQAGQRIREINEAYEVLCDLESRREYDESRVKAEPLEEVAVEPATGPHPLPVELKVGLILGAVGLAVLFVLFILTVQRTRQLGGVLSAGVAARAVELTRTVHSELPEGSTRSEVDAFLERHRLPAADEVPGYVAWGLLGNKVDRQHVRFESCIVSRISDERDATIVEEILLVFCFNTKGSMVVAIVNTDSRIKRGSSRVQK